MVVAPEEDSQSHAAFAGGVLIVGLGGYYYLRLRRRKQEEEEELDLLLEDLYLDQDPQANDDPDPNDDPAPQDPEPAYPEPTFESLCDRLFSGDQDEPWVPATDDQPLMNDHQANEYFVESNSNNAVALLPTKSHQETDRTKNKSPSMKPPKSGKSRSWNFAWVWLIASLILAGSLLGMGSWNSAEPATQSIETLEVGQWVLAGNPTDEQDLEFGAIVEPESWRQLELRAEKIDGSHADVTLLRPSAWIRSHNGQVGGTIPISVPECGIHGDAHILQIAECPQLAPRPGPDYQLVRLFDFTWHN